MSHNAVVGVVDGGTVHSIYVQHGRLLDLAPVLLKHYRRESKVLDLIHEGDAVQIRDEIGRAHGVCDGSNRRKRCKNWSHFYMRDRGEILPASPFERGNMADFRKRLYDGELFLFQNGKWWTTNQDPDLSIETLAKAPLVPLLQALRTVRAQDRRQRAGARTYVTKGRHARR